MKAIKLTLVLCLSMPAFAFAGNELTPAYPQYDEASAPAGLTDNDESSGTATGKIMSDQSDEKYNGNSDPVPMSDYVNDGYYAQ